MLLAVVAGLGLVGVGAWLTIIKPSYGLMGLALLIPVDRGLHFSGVTIYTNELYLTGVGLGFALILLQKQLDWRAVGKYCLLFLPFLVVVLATLMVAQSKFDVIKQFLRWSEFFLVLVVCRFGIKRKEEFKQLLWVLLASGILASAIGLYQHFMGIAQSENAAIGLDKMSQVSGVVRAYSTFGHPNQFAGFLILLVPLAFEVFLESKNIRGQFLVGLVTLTLALALTMTYSRGGWLSAILAIGIIIMYYIPRNLVKSMALFLIFASLLFFLPYYVSKLNSRISSFKSMQSDTAITGRIFYQKLAWEMVQLRPWLGYGAGNYKYAIQKYIDRYPAEGKFMDKHIHNLYSQTAIETGLLGLFAFMLFLVVSLWQLLHHFRNLPLPRDRAMVVAVAASFMAFLLHNNFDVLMIYARGIHFGMVLGMGAALKAMAEKPYIMDEV